MLRPTQRQLGTDAFGTQVRKGRGCLSTCLGFPTATPSVSRVRAYKAMLQIAAALMTEVGKNTGKSVKILYGDKVRGKLNKVVFGDCARKESWTRGQDSRKYFY